MSGWILSRWQSLLIGVLVVGVAAAAVPDSLEYAEPDDATTTTYSFDSLLYQSRVQLRNDDSLNAVNGVVNYPAWRSVLDMRGKLFIERKSIAVSLQPRLRWEQNGFEQTQGPSSRQPLLIHDLDMYLDQAFGRWSSGAHTALIGREVLLWGPASFRSPSNPVYFDAGKTDPLGLLSGLDLLRYSYTADALTTTLAYIYSSTAVEDIFNYKNTSLLKIDYQTSTGLFSINMAQQFDAPAGIKFIGGFMQYTLGDAWLAYAEAGQLHNRQDKLRSQLLGLSYTFNNGRVLAVEYLHGSGNAGRLNGRQQMQQAAMGQLLAATDSVALWGKNYLWLGWNSQAQESRYFWRLEATTSLDDRSMLLAGYYEKNFNRLLTGFVYASYALGGAHKEFTWLQRGAITLGLKWYAF